MTYLKNFYVYAHYKADTNEIFYVGKGIRNRAYSKFNRNTHWKNIVSKHGFTVAIIAEFEHEVEALNLEIELIAHYGRADKGLGPLVNWTDGGEGESGRICKQETRDKIRQNKTTLKGENHPNYGKKFSEELREKLRNNHARITGEDNWNYGKRWYTDGFNNYFLLPTDEKVLGLRSGQTVILTEKQKAVKSKNTLGKKNPMYDHTIYYWVNDNGIEEALTQHDFHLKYNIPKYAVNRLVKHKAIKSRGWSLKSN